MAPPSTLSNSHTTGIPVVQAIRFNTIEKPSFTYRRTNRHKLFYLEFHLVDQQCATCNKYIYTRIYIYSGNKEFFRASQIRQKKLSLSISPTEKKQPIRWITLTEVLKISHETTREARFDDRRASFLPSPASMSPHSLPFSNRWNNNLSILLSFSISKILVMQTWFLPSNARTRNK